MLKKKEYTAILGLAKTKDEIVQFYRKKYSPSPAIRIIRTTYRRSDRTRDYVFLCDKCGLTFMKTEEDDIEYRSESCVCPHCGYAMEYTPNTYYQAKPRYALEESCKGYNAVLTSDGKLLDPTLVFLESVVYESVRYHIIRRFHFDLLHGDIEKSRVYRGLIIPVNEENNYAAFYEKNDGKLTSSSTEHPDKWFETSKYHLPSIREFCVNESAEEYLTEKNCFSNMLIEWCSLLYKSMYYHSESCVEIRKFLADYPVNDFPDDVESEKCYFEDHGDYFAFRMFRKTDEGVAEFKRWIVSVDTGYSRLLVKHYGEWEKESPEGYHGFSDSDLLFVKDEMMKTKIGKMGLFEYMEYHDAISSRSLCGTCYLTSLYYNPIIETLVKIGMSHLVTDVVSEKIKIHDEQKRIWRKLGLSKANFEFAKREHLSSEDLQKLISINEYDEKVDENSFYRWINEFSKADLYSIRIITEHIGVTLKQIMDYMESVYYDQGCECEEGITLWRDYLRNYQNFHKHDPKTDEEKFPDSLKKSHDILAMRNTKWAYDSNAIVRQFKKLMNGWKHLEFEDDTYKMMLPRTPRDITQEGARQHHCVGGYIRSVLDGDCLILFLRRKENEDRSFFTLEYDLHNSIRQIKGKFNHSIGEMLDVKERQKLLNFLAKWSRKTGIDTGVTNTAEVA